MTVKTSPDIELSNREIEVYVLLKNGVKRHRISRLLGFHYTNTSKYIKRILTKMGYETIEELMKDV